MKLNVYQEQYKSGQAEHTPKDIGFGYDINKFKSLGEATIDAANKKIEQDDEINSARIEADTLLAANKLLRDYKNSANPDTFEADTEAQKAAIQNLISTSSQKFKTQKYRNEFTTRMTRSLEPRYIQDVLSYGYNLQETHYKDLVNSAFDSYDAMLLEGDTLVNVQDVLTRKREYRDMLGRRYNIPQDKIKDYAKSSDTKTVTSFAAGMINKNPEMVVNLLAGDDFNKFKASKEALGQGFSMEEFWDSPELQEEYNSSEYAAKWTELLQYVDYPTRLALWKEAYSETERRKKEAVKLKLAANSMSDWEIDKKRDATISEIKASGKMPTDMLIPSSVDYTSDPELGTIGNPIKMGYISKGKLDPGNSYSKASLNFAGGIAGQIEAKGYKTKITSSIRPKDTDSYHKNGGAVDIVFSDKNGLSIQGTIDGYLAAITQYGNNIKKKGVLLEIRNSDLPPALQKQLTRPDGTTIDVLDYIKQNMKTQNIDDSWINWEQSKKYREKSTGGHVHFTMNPNADYTMTNSGQGKKLDFRTPIGAMRYKQKRADGKSVQEAYDAARQDELEIFTALQEQQLISGIVSKQNSDGSYLDPAYYGRALEAHKQAVLNNKKLSDTDRIIALNAIERAQDELPKLQEMYRNNTTDFMLTTRQASTPEEAQVLQVKRYGISPNDVIALTEEEAKTKANQIYSKLPPEEAVQYLSSSSVNPATLRQLAKYMPDDSKSNLLLYSPLASDAMKSMIIDACKDWDNVQKAISQDKKFPENWRAKVIGEFRNNGTVKDYLSDVAKTNPEEAYKLFDTMASLYAYKLYKDGGIGAGRDYNTKSRHAIDYIAKDLIARNFQSATISSTRQKTTTVNIHTSFSESDKFKIERIGSLVSSLGVNPNSVFIPGGSVAEGDGDAVSELNKQQQLKEAHYLDGITKTATLNGTPDGMGIKLIWTNNYGVSDTIKDKDTYRPIIIPNKELVAIYNKAYKEAEAYKIPNSRYYKHPTKTLAVKDLGTDVTVPKSISHTEIVNIMAIKELRNRYKWINQQ